jgi:long-chain acyl-CoA synthetase
MTIADPIIRFAETRPEAPAILEAGGTTTYADLGDRVARTASHLAALGVRRGDRIGLCLGDTTDHLVLLLAASHAGAVATPLDWRARPAETAGLVADLGLTLIVAEPDTDPGAASPIMTLDDDWLQAASGASPTWGSGGEWTDDFAISATSGSTGAPKLTIMSHQEYYFALAGMLELMDLAGPHRYLSTMPLYYSGGRNSCVMHLLRGDCVVLHPHLFGPGEFVELVRSQAITVAGTVPSFVRQLLAEAGSQPSLPDLSVLFSTGAPLHADEKQLALSKLTPNFRERYGTAETLAISILRSEHFATRSGSVGRPHSFLTVQAVDDDNNPTGPDTPGRLRLRGPGIARPLPGAAEANFKGGWFYPGEVAALDQKGFIFLQGRVSDVIIRGGAKIYPAEVEAALLELPEVLDAAVVGGAAEGGEERVTAFVIPRGDLSVGRLIAHCRTRLSPHKVPQAFHLRAEFPLNAAGKTDKLTLARTLPK